MPDGAESWVMAMPRRSSMRTGSARRSRTRGVFTIYMAMGANCAVIPLRRSFRGGTDPLVETGSLHAIRGGAWSVGVADFRSASRGSVGHGLRCYYMGLRAALVPADK